MNRSKNKLDWDNLLDNKCPKCEAELLVKDTGVNCPEKECNFFITHERLEALKENIRERHRSGKIRWHD